MADAVNIPILSVKSTTTRPGPVFLTDEDLSRCDQISGSAMGAIEAIAREVSQQTGIRLGELMGPSREHPIAHARQIVMFIARREGIAYAEIARCLRRDHTTIIHGVRAEAKRRGGK